MKGNLFVVCNLFMMVSSQLAYSQSKVEKEFEKLEWLVGKWERTNSKPGQSGYEEWAKVTPTKITGKGVTLKGKEIVFLEELEINIQGDKIFYNVKISGEPEPVSFKFTSISNKDFVCENAAHDFPKKITYQKKGKNVTAIVSGNGQVLLYEFSPSIRRIN